MSCLVLLGLMQTSSCPWGCCGMGSGVGEGDKVRGEHKTERTEGDKGVNNDMGGGSRLQALGRDVGEGRTAGRGRAVT